MEKIIKWIQEHKKKNNFSYWNVYFGTNIGNTFLV